MTLRFHTPNRRSTLRPNSREQHRATTIQALAAALGGTQSLHTNASTRHLDSRPNERTQTRAATQQVLGYESALPTPSILSPGRISSNRLTNEVERLARELRRGDRCPRGSGGAIESHLHARRDRIGAYEFARQVDRGGKVVVGVNRFERVTPPSRGLPIDEEQQRARSRG